MIRRYLGTSAIVLLALPAAAGQLDTSELLSCHAIAARDERLTCYEALAESAMVAAKAGPTTSMAPTASGSGVAQPTASAASAATTATAGSAPLATTATADPNDPANFGLNRRQVEPYRAETGSLKSVVAQMTEDRRHNITVVLENGQTWTFIEPEPRLRPGDAITIKRASLGSFLMLTPSRRGYRVERLK